MRRVPRDRSTRPGSSRTHAHAFNTLVTHGADSERRVRELPRRRVRAAGRLRSRPRGRASSRTSAASPATAAAARISRPAPSPNGRLPERLPRLPRHEALARLRVRDVPARRSRTRPMRTSSRCRSASVRRSWRSAARCAPICCRPTARHVGSDACRSCHAKEYETLGRGSARARARDARGQAQGERRELPEVPHDRLRPRGRFPARRRARRRTPISPASAASPATGRAAITSPRANEARNDRRARRQVRLVRDPPDLRLVPRRCQRSRLRVRGEGEDRQDPPRDDRSRHGQAAARPARRRRAALAPERRTRCSRRPSPSTSAAAAE